MGEAAPPGAVEFVQRRLSALSKSLGDKPYLDDVAGGVRRARAMEQHTAGQKRHPDDTWVHGGGGIPAGNE